MMNRYKADKQSDNALKNQNLFGNYVLRLFIN